MKRITIAGHPVHPPLVHMPIGLLASRLLWDLTGLWRGEPLWWGISFWCTAAGLLLALPAAATGFLDYLALSDEGPLERLANRHMLLVGGALCAYGGGLIVQGGWGAPEEGRVVGTVVLSALGLLLLAAGGAVGGHMVYRHGAGVQIEGGEPP